MVYASYFWGKTMAMFVGSFGIPFINGSPKQ